MLQQRSFHGKAGTPSYRGYVQEEEILPFLGLVWCLLVRGLHKLQYFTYVYVYVYVCRRREAELLIMTYECSWKGRAVTVSTAWESQGSLPLSLDLARALSIVNSTAETS